MREVCNYCRYCQKAFLKHLTYEFDSGYPGYFFSTLGCFRPWLRQHVDRFPVNLLRLDSGGNCGIDHPE